MAQHPIDKKYMQDFEKLQKNWARLIQQPNSEHLNTVMKDLQQFQSDLRNIRFHG